MDTREALAQSCSFASRCWSLGPCSSLARSPTNVAHASPFTSLQAARAHALGLHVAQPPPTIPLTLLALWLNATPGHKDCSGELCLSARGRSNPAQLYRRAAASSMVSATAITRATSRPGATSTTYADCSTRWVIPLGLCTPRTASPRVSHALPHPAPRHLAQHAICVAAARKHGTAGRQYRVGDAAAVDVGAVEHPEVLALKVPANRERRQRQRHRLAAPRIRLKQRVHKKHLRRTAERLSAPPHAPPHALRPG